MILQKVFLPNRNGAYMDACLQRNCTELEMIRWDRRPAMLVVPGGAYDFVSEREGEPLALRYAAAGFQTFLLHYTVGTCFQDALLDIAAAMAQIRRRAEEWQIDPHQVAVLGSSAGGHLALWLAIKAALGDAALLPICESPQMLRPNALVLCYPAVYGTGCHASVVKTLPKDDVCACAGILPPAFLWATQDDHAVPPGQLLHLATAMTEANVPLELHLYQRGDHGLATADEATGRPVPHVAGWLPLSIDWLYQQFSLKPSDPTASIL